MWRAALAAVLSLGATGLGHALIGRQRYAFSLLIFATVAVVVPFTVSAVMFAFFGRPWAPLVLLGVILAGGIRVYAVCAAGRDAYRLPGPFPQHALRRVMVFGVVAFLLSLPLTTLVVQAFREPSDAIAPTLKIGDHFLVNKLVYGPRFELPWTGTILGQWPALRSPATGDVVVVQCDPQREPLLRSIRYLD